MPDPFAFMAVSYLLRLSLCFAVVASHTVEVLVDAAAGLEQGDTISPAALFEASGSLHEGIECPVSDKVSLGTSCSCGGKTCEKQHFCFALESDKPSCQKHPRHDPSRLDWYGITKNGPADGTDNGVIQTRKLKFYKKSDSSGLRLFYSDNFRAHCGGHGSGSNRWELQIDGKKCPSSHLAQDFHVHNGENPHRINGWGAYCSGISKGDHTLTVRVSPTPGYETSGRHDAYTGWDGWGSNKGAWHMEVQEIPSDYPLYHQVSGSNKADGRDNGIVNGRQLKFKKLYKDSLLRLFYSDNLRSYGGGHARACRWEIRVDGRTCTSGRIAGDVYVHRSDNPHRPRSFAGYCDNVGVGEHTVDVWVDKSPAYSSCDAYTGWHPTNGGHYVLEAEEIPKASAPMVHYQMKHQSDGRDSGTLTSYKMSFTKQHEDTVLRLFWTENLRALSYSHACACKWELLLDDKPCSNAAISGQVYVHRHHGSNDKDTNPHRVKSFGGFCEKVGKGSHHVQAHLKQQGPHCDCYTGWLNSPGGNGAHGLIEVHEFFKPCTSLEKSGCEGRCYWNEKEDKCWDAPPCPGHDKIAVGTACKCKEEKIAEEGKYCYEDGTVADKPPEEKSLARSVDVGLPVFLLAAVLVAQR